MINRRKRSYLLGRCYIIEAVAILLGITIWVQATRTGQQPTTRGQVLAPLSGVGFVSLTDAIDTTTASGRFFFNVMASLGDMDNDYEGPGFDPGFDNDGGADGD